EITDFISKNTPYQYWLGKSFLLLADIYLSQNDQFQAKHTLKSLYENYNDENDGIKAEAAEKLLVIENAEKSEQQKAIDSSFQIKINQQYKTEVMLNTIKSVLLVATVTLSFVASAQRDTTLNREVEVVKSFKPTIQDAHKINDMPKIDETEHQKPTFNYSIKSEPVINTFAVTPLKAASIASAPKEETGYGL